MRKSKARRSPSGEMDTLIAAGITLIGDLFGPAIDRQMRRLEKWLFDDGSGPPPRKPHEEYEEDCYKVLQVRRNASREEIEAAFKARVVKLHPDKVAHMDPKFVNFAKVETQRLNKAREEALRRL